jgi:hypothetical protein
VQTIRKWRFPRWAALGGVSLYLLFAHGCHGKDDADLLIRLPEIVAINR